MGIAWASRGHRVGDHRVCGTPQLHGLYLVWTRRVDNKTLTRTLDAAQADVLRPLAQSARRLPELTTELETLAAAGPRQSTRP